MDAVTRYARNGDVSIAYQVVGDGPFDLVLVPGSTSHLEFGSTLPELARYGERLASFCRLIVFDKRGTGMSDRVGIATLEERMDDVRAVMDAAGSDRAAIFGVSEGGAMAALFAATDADRTLALVLYGTIPRVTSAPGWVGIPVDDWNRVTEELLARFGEGPALEHWAPSVAGRPGLQEWFAQAQRMSVSPGALRTLQDMLRDLDVRAVLPTIRVPTLVLHRAGDRIIPAAVGRYTASRIPDAKYVELPGDDHLPMFGDVEALLGEVEEFLTGTRHPSPPDRVLATVVFTDIVGSTQLAAQLGDAEWRRLLDRHDDAVRRQVMRHDGRLIKSTGDGVLATFDGPARAARFAAALDRDAAELGLRLRAGVHTGEIEVRGNDIGGIAVHIAARVAALADGGEILASRTVKDLTAGSGLAFEDRGVHALKGVPDDWPLYAVTV